MIASGYSHMYRYDYNGPKPVLDGKDDTREFLYDVSSLPDDGTCSRPCDSRPRLTLAFIMHASFHLLCQISS
eukprot:scaffold1882_cov181-Skeletonema_marinoi.AAC.16